MDLGDHGRNLLPYSADQITPGTTQKNSPQASIWDSGIYDTSNQDNLKGVKASSEYPGFQEQFISDGSPPKVPPRGLWGKITRFESETWLLEIINLCVSMAATVTAIVYLKRFDGRPLPEWPKGITLNTLLSVCITIMGATLSIPISSGLGQLMWIRAKKAHVPLSKMDTLDKASRGGWGSILVIFGWAGGPLGALGGLTFLLALISAPLSQQAIHITSNQTLSPLQQASIVRCNGSTGIFPNDQLFYDGKGESSVNRVSTRNQLPSMMQGAYYNAIYSNYAPTSFSEAFATCMTGNCTWEPFSTLSLCNQCKNVTSSLVASPFSNGETEAHTQYTLPGGVNLNPRILYNISDSKPSDRIHHSYVTAMLFSAAGYVSINNGSDRNRPEAIECALAYCVQVIQPKITNGILEETVLETYEFEDSTITERVRAHTIKPPAGNPYFKDPISVDFYDAIWVGAAASFKSAIGVNTNKISAEAWVLWEGGFDKFGKTFDNIAAAMGRALRVTCRGDLPSEMVTGSAWVPVTKVGIRWYWLAVPFLVEVLGLAFFVAIVVLHSRSGTKLWKTSFLAVNFHSLKLGELRYRPEMERLERVFEMEQAAKFKVRLVDEGLREGGRSRLVYS